MDDEQTEGRADMKVLRGKKLVAAWDKYRPYGTLPEIIRTTCELRNIPMPCELAVSLMAQELLRHQSLPAIIDRAADYIGGLQRS
jgi:hypothetical protein